MQYLPEFAGVIEGYTVNFITKNYWRVKPTHTHEEAMQEAYVVFLRCASAYPILDTPQHFMALYKTALANEWHDLSVKATEARALVSNRMFDEHDEEMTPGDIIGDLDNDGMLAVMIKQAPHEVVMVLNLFLNAPQELLDLAFAAWRKNGRYRADGDKAVSRMLGLPAGSTPMTATRNYFEDPTV